MGPPHLVAFEPESTREEGGLRLTDEGDSDLDVVRPISIRDVEVVGEFETDHGERLPLYAGYHDRIKAIWRRCLWSTQSLLAIQSHVDFDNETAAFLEAL